MRSTNGCGKHTSLIYEQFVELLRMDLARLDGDAAAVLGPPTPGKVGNHHLGNAKDFDFNDGEDDDDELLRKHTPFTSLLMLPMSVDFRVNDRVAAEAEGDVTWDSNPTATHKSAQIWDFLSRRSSNMGVSVLEKFFLHGSHSGSIYVPILDPSSISALDKEKKNSTNPIHFVELPLSAAVATNKADMEPLAKNRGNAMLRYKEKKKTQSYDKHIRYESRKAGAETRKRVKGRFVKASETPQN